MSIFCKVGLYGKYTEYDRWEASAPSRFVRTPADVLQYVPAALYRRRYRHRRSRRRDGCACRSRYRGLAVVDGAWDRAGLYRRIFRPYVPEIRGGRPYGTAPRDRTFRQTHDIHHASHRCAEPDRAAGISLCPACSDGAIPHGVLIRSDHLRGDPVHDVLQFHSVRPARRREQQNPALCHDHGLRSQHRLRRTDGLHPPLGDCRGRRSHGIRASCRRRDLCVPDRENAASALPPV